MKLLQFATSQYCEKARWVLDFKGVDYETTEVPYRSPIHMGLQEHTGRTTVPVIQTDSGQWVRDSTVIALHLDKSHPEPPLLPADPNALTATRLWDDWADDVLGPTLYTLHVHGIVSHPELKRKSYARTFGHGPLGPLYPLLSGVFERRYRSASQSDGGRWRWAVDRAAELADLLAGHLENRAYVVGESFTLADLSIATMLGLVHRPDTADPHPVVGRGWRAPNLPDTPAMKRVIEWQSQIYAQHRRRSPVAAPSGPT